MLKVVFNPFTGNFDFIDPSTSSGQGYSGTVANYSALPSASTVTGEFWFVLNSQGTAWLPGSLGGTYYPNGTYYSDGVNWITGISPYQATQGAVNAGIITDQFVSPNTLANWSGRTSGTVTSVSIVTANGISGSVATPTTTPAITLTLSNITPTTVNGLTLVAQSVGFTIAGGTTSKTLTVPLNATVSGTNTGDQTITLTSDVTGSGTGSFATTIASHAVSYAKFQQVSAVSLLGNPTGSTTNVSEITLGSGLSFSGTTLVSTGTGGTVTSIGMTVPTILSVSPSSITTSGTFAITLANQTANIVFAGPSSGGATTPTFRTLVNADMSSITTAGISENTNLYFTNARAIAAPITGYVSGAGTVLATDSILQAIQKLNGNSSTIVSSQWITSGSDIYYSTGNVLIGSSGTPAAKLHTIDTGTSSPRGIILDQYSTGTNSSQVNARKARGTFASPTTIVVSDILSNFNSWAYDGTAFLNAAAIRTTSVGTIATNRTPTKMEFYTMTDVSTGVLTLALTLDQNQAAIFAGHLTVEGVTSTGATGTGKFVFDGSPTLVTPTLGVASATTINKVTITTPATGSTLTIADGKTLTMSNTLTFTGTDSSSVAFGAGGTVVYTNVTTLSSLVSVSTITTGTWASTISNAATVTLKDTLFTLQDDGDTTKQLQFQLNGITTATTRTLTIPNVNGTIITTGDTGTVTNTMLAGSIDLTTKVTGILPGTNGGTGVNNSTRTLTYAGNVIFTGAFNATFAIPQTTTWTLPNTASETLAGLGTAQTFSAKQTFTASTTEMASITLLDTTYKTALDVSAATNLRLGNGFANLTTPCAQLACTAAFVLTGSSTMSLTSTKATTGTAITIQNSNSTFNSLASGTPIGTRIQLGTVAPASGSGTITALSIAGVFSPTGTGSAAITFLSIDTAAGSIIQNSTNTGVITYLDINPTITAMYGTSYGIHIRNYGVGTGNGTNIAIQSDHLGASIFNGDFKLNTAGNGIYIKEGSNATMGTATLVLGVATVSTTKVTANSRIFLTVESLGTIASPVAVSVTARSAGTSFTITSANLTDTSLVSWVIIEPA